MKSYKLHRREALTQSRWHCLTLSSQVRKSTTAATFALYLEYHQHSVQSIIQFFYSASELHLLFSSS